MFSLHNTRTIHVAVQGMLNNRVQDRHIILPPPYIGAAQLPRSTFKLTTEGPRGRFPHPSTCIMASPFRMFPPRSTRRWQGLAIIILLEFPRPLFEGKEKEKVVHRKITGVIIGISMGRGGRIHQRRGSWSCGRLNRTRRGGLVADEGCGCGGAAGRLERKRDMLGNEGRRERAGWGRT